MARPIKPIDAPVHKNKRHGPVEGRQLEWIEHPVDPLKIGNRTRFTRAMVARAHEDGIGPHEALFAIGMDPTIEFDDYTFVAGQLVPIKRHATMEERVKCLTAVLPYYVEKKAQVVEQNGEIKIIHALDRSPLSNVKLDSIGRVIAPAETIDFDETDSD